jgi:hypothetical protein
MRQLYLPVLILIALGYPGLTSLVLLTGGTAGNLNLWVRIAEAGLLAALLLATPRRVRIANAALWPVIVFLAIYGIRLLYDVVILNILMFSQTPLYALGYFFALTFLPLLAVFFLFKEPDMRLLLRWIVYVLVATNITLLIYALLRGSESGSGLFSGRIEERGEVEGTAVLGPLWFGLCGAGLGAVIVGYLASSAKQTNTLRIAALILILVCLANVLFSASRGPLVAFLVAFLFLVIKLLGVGKFGGKKGARWQGWLLVLSVVGCISWALLSVEGDVFLFDRFTKMLNDRQTGILEERDLIRIAAWNDFLSAPLFGRSYVVSHENASAHNIVLDSLISTGVVGTAFFALGLWRTGASVWALLGGMRGPEGVALAMFTIVVSVMAMTSGSIGQSPEFWIFSALVIVAAASATPLKPAMRPAKMGNR